MKRSKNENPQCSPDPSETEQKLHLAIVAGLFFQKPSTLKLLPWEPLFPGKFEKKHQFPIIFSDDFGKVPSHDQISKALSKETSSERKARRLFEFYDFLIKDFVNNEQIAKEFSLEREAFNDEYLRFLYLKIKDQTCVEKKIQSISKPEVLLELEKILGNYHNICAAFQINMQSFERVTGLTNPSVNEWMTNTSLVESIKKEIEEEINTQTNDRKIGRNLAVLRVLQNHDLKIYDVKSLCETFQLNRGNFFSAKIFFFHEREHFAFHYTKEEEDLIREVRESSKRYPTAQDKMRHIVNRYENAGYRGKKIRYFVDIFKIKYLDANYYFSSNKRNTLNVLTDVREEDAGNTALKKFKSAI